MAYDIEKSIVPLLKSQFPEFYVTEESFLVDFLEAYYTWMEQDGQALGYARNIHDSVDIDKTLEEFIIHFKRTYMDKLPLQSKVDTRVLIKQISSLYKAKGSYQSFKLLFRILFDSDASLYYPGDDVLRASDGDWIEPIYPFLRKQILILTMCLSIGT